MESKASMGMDPASLVWSPRAAQIEVLRAFGGCRDPSAWELGSLSPATEVGSGVVEVGKSLPLER
jgi:hypothetical protein